MVINRHQKEEGFIIEEETIYCEDFREQMLEDDQIKSWENGFMQGYEEAMNS